MKPSPFVKVQQLGPSVWRIHVPGRYLTIAEGELERDAAMTIASAHARAHYAEAYGREPADWRGR